MDSKHPVKLDFETRLGHAVASFERLLIAREAGLRLALVLALFAIGLTFLFSPSLFESFKSFDIIKSAHEWIFGCVVLLLCAWLMFSSRGVSRRFAVLACAVWWFFWGLVNHSGAGVFTPGTATYLVLWALSSIEMYRECARPVSRPMTEEAAP